MGETKNIKKKPIEVYSRIPKKHYKTPGTVVLPGEFCGVPKGI